VLQPAPDAARRRSGVAQRATDNAYDEYITPFSVFFRFYLS